MIMKVFISCRPKNVCLICFHVNLEFLSRSVSGFHFTNASVVHRVKKHHMLNSKTPELLTASMVCLIFPLWCCCCQLSVWRLIKKFYSEDPICTETPSDTPLSDLINQAAYQHRLGSASFCSRVASPFCSGSDFIPFLMTTKSGCSLSQL